MHHRSIRKAHAALAVAIVLLLALPWIAVADDISNNLDGSVDAVAEVMALNAGGSNGTTTLYVVPRNSDVKNGCNLTGSTTLVVSVASNNTAVATASPASVTFSSCGDTKILTVTPHSQGSATLSLSQTSNNTGGTFNLGTATFTVNVAPPANTAPSVTVTGVTAGQSYEIGAVPSAGCAVQDADDGPTTFAATLSAVSGPLAAFGLGEQTASCSYTDGGGLTAAASITYAVVDTGAPVIIDLGPVAGADGANGWYTTPVTNRFRASDTGAGFAAQPNPYEFNQSSGAGEGQAVTIPSGPVADVAGNINLGLDSAAFMIDLSDPYGVTGTPERAPDRGDWYNAPVAFNFSGQDDISGIASCSTAVNYSGPDGAGVSVDGSCTDVAGRSSGLVASTPVNYDATAPTNISGAPDRQPDSHGWYNHAVTFTFTGTDAVSDIDGCTATTYTGPDGQSLSVSGTCTDNAGNTSAAVASPSFGFDATPPAELAFIGGPADGDSYYFGSVPSAPTCSATDATSGLDTCVVSGYATTVGAHTLTATATDAAGNQTQLQRSYTVLAWTLTGFKQPVDMGIINNVRAGSTVPLKFEVFAGPTELSDTNVVAWFTQRVNCASGVGDDIEQYATGNTSLRYDATAGQFIFNWQTPRAAGSCYRVTLETQDGSKISADFRLK
jgi:hypothetical protein